MPLVFYLLIDIIKHRNTIILHNETVDGVFYSSSRYVDWILISIETVFFSQHIVQEIVSDERFHLKTAVVTLIDNFALKKL